MSNSVGGNPWSITDASATALTTEPIWINRLVWKDPTTAGHTCVVTDKSGRVIWSKYAIAGGNGIDYELPCGGEMYKGLIVTTLGSGTLYIHLDNP